MIDRANIYKLSKAEQTRISESPLGELAPNVKTFAKDFKEYIKNSDTPYVVGLNGGYGTGKTFFSTRFCEYLKNEEIEAIYFSVWENDYLPNPFMAFSKEIVNYVLQNSYIKRCKKKFVGVKDNVLKVFGAAISSVNLSASTGEGSIDISGEKFVENLKKYNDEPDSNDPIIELKNTLSNLILKLKNKKLVLIVDELDRCRPDYAVKTLETIKHFFDIEGLFVILPINKNRLEDCINGFYNLKYDNSKENYLQKFINDDSRKIPSLDYENICNRELDDELFKDVDNIEISGEGYNSLFQLKKWLVYYSKGFQLTYREILEVIKIAIEICKYEKEKIRCHYLAFKLCEIKNKHNNHRTSFSLDIISPYSTDYDYNNPNLKRKLFDDCKKNAGEIKSKVGGPIHHRIFGCISRLQTASTYKDIETNIGEFTLEIDKIIEDYKERQWELGNSNYTNMLSGKENLLKVRKEIKKIYNEYGSDDNDEERIKRYDELVNAPEKLFKEETPELPASVDKAS